MHFDVQLFPFHWRAFYNGSINVYAVPRAVHVRHKCWRAEPLYERVHE